MPWIIQERADLKPIPLGFLLIVALSCATGCSHFGNRQACGEIGTPESALVKQGYFTILRRCEYVYCNNGPATGSQLAVRQCHTAAELHHKSSEARELLNRPLITVPDPCTTQGTAC